MTKCTTSLTGFSGLYENVFEGNDVGVRKPPEDADFAQHALGILWGGTDISYAFQCHLQTSVARHFYLAALTDRTCQKHGYLGFKAYCVVRCLVQGLAHRGEGAIPQHLLKNITFTNLHQTNPQPESLKSESSIRPPTTTPLTHLRATIPGPSRHVQVTPRTSVRGLNYLFPGATSPSKFGYPQSIRLARTC